MHFRTLFFLIGKSVLLFFLSLFVCVRFYVRETGKTFSFAPQKKNACCLTIPAEQVTQFVKKSVGAFFHRDAHFFYSLLTLSQFLSFKICHKTFANFIKFFDRRIERLLNCEKVGYKKHKMKTNE